MFELDLNILQDEVSLWSRHNFGDQPTVNPLLGAVEELGELDEHYTRWKNARDTGDLLGDKDTHHANTEDAVGDMMIYLADYCGRAGLNMAQCEIIGARSHVTADPVINSAIEVGKLAHAHLKCAQGIRTTEDHEMARRTQVGRLIVWLRLFGRNSDMDFDGVVINTWEEVRKRDWKKDPAGAGVGEDTPAPNNP